MRFQTDTSRQTHHIEVLCVANEQEHEGISHELCIGYWTKMVAKYYSHLLLSSSKAAGCLIPPHSNSFSMINTEKLHKNSFSTNSTRSNARKNSLTTCANGTTPAPVKSMSAPARSRSLAWDLRLLRLFSSEYKLMIIQERIVLSRVSFHKVAVRRV